MSWFDSYYGGYRTRSFSDIFPDYETFSTEYTSSGIPLNLLTGTVYNTLCSLETIYYLLISRYASSHIRSSDENVFKLRVFRKIYEFAPAWQRNMYIQDKALKMSDDEVLRGSKAIYNHALNPSSEPSTASLQELAYIDNQSTTNYIKDRREAWTELASMINTNFTQEFIEQFAELFNGILYPDSPLLYVTED